MVRHYAKPLDIRGWELYTDIFEALILEDFTLLILMALPPFGKVETFLPNRVISCLRRSLYKRLCLRKII